MQNVAFSLDPESTFALALAASLDVPLAPREDRTFKDGEHKLRPPVDPLGRDIYIIDSLYGSPAAARTTSCAAC